MNLKRLKNYLVITLLALVGISASASTSSLNVAGKKQVLFSTAEDGEHPYRIPAIATLINGDILAISDYRPCNKDVGNGEVDIYAKVSKDNGATWTPSTKTPGKSGGLKIADGSSSNGYGDAAVVVDRESGDVLVICVAGNVAYSSGSSSKHNKMARIRADFNESTGELSWTSPVDVTDAFFKNLLPDAYTMFMASGRMIQSQFATKDKTGGTHDRIYGSLLVLQKKNIFTKENANYVVYSDDFGETWKLLGGGACSTSDANEAKVEELPNGDIVFSARRDNKGGRNYNVFSFTNLENATGSWDSVETCSFAGSNSTNGELMIYHNVTNASTKEKTNIILQSLPTGSSRSNVAVYYKVIDNTTSYSSSNFTSGWTKGIEVDDGASAYSTMTILKNGEIGFMYEDDYTTSTYGGGGCEIVYVPLKVSEITGGAYTYVEETTEEPVVETVATPTFTPNGGEIEAGTTISISCATEGATIYYSTNGAEPTTVYSAPFALNNVATVKAVAKKEGWNDSEIAAASFTIKQEVVEPEEPTQPSTPAVAKFRIKNVQKDGKVFYFTYSATDGIGLTADVEQAAQYTRKTVNEANGVYAFQVEDGSYLIWSGKGEDYPGYYDGKGYVAESEYDAAKCDLTVAPMVAGGNVESFEGTYYTIMGEREGKKSWGKAKIEDVYFVIKNDMTFSAGMDPYFNDTYSSAFLIEEVVEEPEPAVAAPVFSLPSGTYDEGVELTISCPTEGARIFIAEAGTTPTAESGEIPNGLTTQLYESLAISAIAILDGECSEVVTYEYVIEEKPEVVVETVATPMIIPYGGEIESDTEIRIICNTENATIHYTTDGTEPTEDSPVYDGPFTLEEDATVKAIAVKEGWNNSAVVSVNFTVKVVEPELHSWAVNVVGGKMNGRTRYMAPFSAPCNIELPNNVKAYYVKNYTSNNTTLTRIWSSIIPAYQGVILEASAEGEITITAAEEWATPARMSNNKLVDTADGPVVLESDAYVFEKNSSTGSMTFYKKTAGTTIPQNSCYLVKSGSLFPSILSIDFDEDSEFSGINDVNAEDAEVEYYNLQGVKVENPEKGIYIMKQGGKTSKVVL